MIKHYKKGESKSMNLFQKLKSFFNPLQDDKDKSTMSNSTNKVPIKTHNQKKDIEIDILDINPNVYLVGTAAKLSIGQLPLSTYEERLQHIQKLMKRGHESILEHSNIVAIISIPLTISVSLVLDLIDVLVKSRYLHIATKEYKGTFNILIGGSIRGYINTVREVKPFNTLIEDTINKILYRSVEKEFLYDLLDNHLLKETETNYREKAQITFREGIDDDGQEITEAVAQAQPDPPPIEDKNVSLIYAENFEKVFFKAAKYGFSLRDIYRVTTITFLFHDISRSTGNQLTRHRVGITQESQRYVEHSTNKYDDFINPIELHKEWTTRYKNLVDFNKVDNYLKKKDIFAIYKYLRDNGVYKEDARAWLPMNVTTKILMTFTYKQFAKFLELRTDQAAQLEIRLVANQCQNLLYNLFFLTHGVSTQGDIHTYMRQTFVNKALQNEAMLNHSSGINDQEYLESLKIDEEEDYISTEIVQNPENDMKSLEINSIEDAERYLKQNEEFKKLKED